MPKIVIDFDTTIGRPLGDSTELMYSVKTAEGKNVSYSMCAHVECEHLGINTRHCLDNFKAVDQMVRGLIDRAAIKKSSGS